MNENETPEVVETVETATSELSQVAETFDALEAAGVDIPAMSEEDYKSLESTRILQDRIAKYMASQANHQDGKKFTYSDATYVVHAYPHKGMWMKKEKELISNPNMNNNSVRRKLAKNPNKYQVVNL